MSLKYAFIASVGALAIPTAVVLTGLYQHELPEARNIADALAGQTRQTKSVKVEKKCPDAPKDAATGLSVYQPECK